MIYFLNSLLFIFACGGAVGMAIFLLPNLAHAFFAIVEQTAVGIDDVNWPDDSLVDKLFKPLYLFWQFIVWFALFWVLLLVIPPGVSKTVAGTLVILVVSLWLFFPISVLSSFGSESPFLVVYPPLVGKLTRHAIHALISFALLGLFISVGSGLILLGLLVHGLFLPVAAFVAIFGFFLHARLLGRLAWVLREGKHLPLLKPKQTRPDTRAEPPLADAFPAPLPNLEAPLAQAIVPAVPTADLAVQEAIQAGEPLAGSKQFSAGMPPVAHLRRQTEEDYVPVVDVEEVHDKPITIPIPNPAPNSEDLPPLPLLPDEDEEVFVLKLEEPAAPNDPSRKVQGESAPEEPDLLPLEPRAPAKTEADSAPTPYALKAESGTTWRAEAGLPPAPFRDTLPLRPIHDEAKLDQPAKPSPLVGLWDEAPKPLAVDRPHRSRPEISKKSPPPFLQGIFDFPFYNRSVRPLLYLTLLAFLELLFIKMILWKIPGPE